MWTACPHHLLIPSFAFAFKAERDNIHSRMGVNLDDIFTAAASVLFYIPVIRDIVLTLGGRVASPEVLDGMKMFALAPGGIHEMIRQGDGVDRIYLRTGFLRFAIKKQVREGEGGKGGGEPKQDASTYPILFYSLPAIT